MSELLPLRNPSAFLIQDSVQDERTKTIPQRSAEKEKRTSTWKLFSSCCCPAADEEGKKSAGEGNTDSKHSAASPVNHIWQPLIPEADDTDASGSPAGNKGQFPSTAHLACSTELEMGKTHRFESGFLCFGYFFAPV
ncbi:hypothetical protein AVEN_232478-1 [Araneus ventricosus]|uniref:Uncharacterized protein n=1 Tax=Araneus ventricosus TaxID=182803 RepID=A0A4Y2QQH6_ARAVE|nr:hypothetical protein AVEN_232478-1 [Araneus ventricosus]